MHERIAIVGASARAMAESAVRAGCRVAACDLFADQDLRAVAESVRVCPPERYPEKLADLLSELNPDAWCYTGALENHPNLIARMRQSRPLWGNPEGVVRLVRDLRRLAEVLQAAGFAFPRTVPGVEADKAFESYQGWILKSGVGAAGSHVRRWSGEPPAPDEWLQEYVEGTHCSAVYAAGMAGVELLGATRQILARDVNPSAPKEFRYVGNTGPLPLEDLVRARLVRLGETLAGAFGLRGVFGVDYVLAGGEIRPIEVNPRWPASSEVIERASGQSVFARHAAAFRGPPHAGGWPRSAADPSSAAPGEGRFATRFIVYAPRAGRLRHGAPRRWRDDDGSDFACADIPAAGALHRLGEPILTLLLGHLEQDEGIERAREAADRFLCEWFEPE